MRRAMTRPRVPMNVERQPLEERVLFVTTDGRFLVSTDTEPCLVCRGLFGYEDGKCRECGSPGDVP